jgi:hypothetical protein
MTSLRRCIGIRAGQNRHGSLVCTLCKKGPEEPRPDGVPYLEGNFMFYDSTGVRNYMRFGLCQDCQDEWIE